MCSQILQGVRIITSGPTSTVCALEVASDPLMNWLGSNPKLLSFLPVTEKVRDRLVVDLIAYAFSRKRVEELLQKHPGLYLVGNYMRGVSVNDCVVHARRTANRLIGQLQKQD